MAKKPVTRVRLLVASRLLTLAFNRAGVGLCLVDPDSTVITANARWLGDLGITAEQAVGRNILELVPDLGDLAGRARAGETIEFRRSARHFDSGEICLEGSVTPIPMGRSSGILITARKLSTRICQQHEPHSANPSQDERLSTVSAELQRRLATIRHEADMIQQAGEKSDRVHRSADAIFAAAEQAESLTTEMTELVRRPAESSKHRNLSGLLRLVLRFTRQPAL